MGSCDEASQMQGWLWKRWPATYGKWQKRWCTLSHKDGFTWYETPDQSRKRGRFDVDGETRAFMFTASEAPGDAHIYAPSRPFGFVVDVHSGTYNQNRDPFFCYIDAGDGRRAPTRLLYYFDSNDERQTSEWILAINKFSSEVQGAGACRHGLPSGMVRFGRAVVPARAVGGGLRATSEPPWCNRSEPASGGEELGARGPCMPRLPITGFWAEGPAGHVDDRRCVGMGESTQRDYGCSENRATGAARSSGASRTGSSIKDTIDPLREIRSDSAIDGAAAPLGGSTCIDHDIDSGRGRLSLNESACAGDAGVTCLRGASVVHTLPAVPAPDSAMECQSLGSLSSRADEARTILGATGGTTFFDANTGHVNPRTDSARFEDSAKTAIGIGDNMASTAAARSSDASRLSSSIKDIVDPFGEIRSGSAIDGAAAPLGGSTCIDRAIDSERGRVSSNASACARDTGVTCLRGTSVVHRLPAVPAPDANIEVQSTSLLSSYTDEASARMGATGGTTLIDADAGHVIQHTDSARLEDVGKPALRKPASTGAARGASRGSSSIKDAVHCLREIPSDSAIEGAAAASGSSRCIDHDIDSGRGRMSSNASKFAGDAGVTFVRGASVVHRLPAVPASDSAMGCQSSGSLANHTDDAPTSLDAMGGMPDRHPKAHVADVATSAGGVRSSQAPWLDQLRWLRMMLLEEISGCIQIMKRANAVEKRLGRLPALDKEWLCEGLRRHVGNATYSARRCELVLQAAAKAAAGSEVEDLTEYADECKTMLSAIIKYAATCMDVCPELHAEGMAS